MKKNIKEQTKKVDCSTCGNPDQCRVCMFRFMILPSKNNKNKPYFVGDLDSFLSQKFQNSSSLKSLYNLLVSKNIYQLTYTDFVKKYACDIVTKSNVETWGDAFEICKSTLPPEPIKKVSSFETVKKYSESDIYPFTNGVPVERPNGIGYYEKEYTDNGGRKGKLRYSSPDEKGFVDVAFWYEDRLRWQKKDKVGTLLESIKRKRIISETLTKDLKVINLLKLIREIHTQKKKTINRSFIFEQGGLSDAQAKARFESISSKYFQDTNQTPPILNWNDTDLLDAIAREIVDLISQGYKGLMFKYFKTAIELLTQITPGETGKEDELDPSQYSSILTMLNQSYSENPKSFNNLVTSEIDSNKYSLDIPSNLKNYFKNSIYRPNSTGATTGDSATYRTKIQDAKNCQDDLFALYTDAQGAFRNKNDYDKTQEFKDRKTFLRGCDGKGYFRKTANIVTPNDKRFFQMYNQLDMGLITNKDGSTVRVQNYALKK